MAGVGVIVNPHARGNRSAHARVSRLRAILGSDGEVVATENISEIDRELVGLRTRGIEILAVCGGDGSFHRVISSALKVWGEEDLPLVLPLRGGTINNLSRSVGTRRRRPESMLRHVIENQRRGCGHDTVEGDLILINGGHYGHTVAAGMMVKFLRLYYAGRRPRPTRAVWLLGRAGISYFFSTDLIRSIAEPIDAKVTCDGERLPFRSYLLLVASSIPYIGLGFKPFYRCGHENGNFHLLAGNSTPGELLRRVWCFHRGRPANLETLYDKAAREVRIEFAEPQPLTIDGDILDPVDVLELRAGPRVRYIRG